MVGLAALALIASVIALAVVKNGSHQTDNGLPGSAATPSGGWYSALAAPTPLATRSRRTACGDLLNAKTLGIAHPALPCNVKIYIEYGDKRVLTAVIDRAGSIAGPEFHLTKALADSIGLHGTQPIHWRYATDTSG
jgi:rare lipoprotein A (peptidoglycan hydrolase)